MPRLFIFPREADTHPNKGDKQLREAETSSAPSTVLAFSHIATLTIMYSLVFMTGL